MNTKHIVIFCALTLLSGCLFTNPAPADPDTPTPDVDMARVDMGGDVDMEADMDCAEAPSQQTACANAQAECGAVVVMNECGDSVEVSCGSCGELERCEQNQCVCDAPAPQQAIRCGQSEGEFCGEYDIFDGCGGVSGTARCDECGEGLACDEQAKQCVVDGPPCDCDPGQTCNAAGECEDRCEGPTLEQVCGESPTDHNSRCRTSFTTTCSGELGVVSCPETMANTRDPLYCSEVAISNPVPETNNFATAVLLHDIPAVDGELLFVGASDFSGGVVHMYLVSNSGEVLHHDQLTSIEISTEVSSLGASLQAIGNTLFVGAPGSRSGGIDNVIALRIDTSDRLAPKFDRSALNHRMLDIPNTLGEKPAVGSALLLDPNRSMLFVGAPGAFVGQRQNIQGRVIAYKVDDTSKPSDWAHATIASPTGDISNQEASFGASLALIPVGGSTEDALAVGAPRLPGTDQSGQGAVYILDDRAGNWSISKEVRAPVNTSNFGNALHGASAKIFVGAPSFSSTSATPSKVYLLQSALNAGIPDWNLDMTPIHTDSDTNAGITLTGRGDDLVITASGRFGSSDDAYALHLNVQGLEGPRTYAPSRPNGDTNAPIQFGVAASFGDRFIAIGDSTTSSGAGMKFGAVHLFPID